MPNRDRGRKNLTAVDLASLVANDVVHCCSSLRSSPPPFLQAKILSTDDLSTQPGASASNLVTKIPCFHTNHKSQKQIRFGPWNNAKLILVWNIGLLLHLLLLCCSSLHVTSTDHFIKSRPRLNWPSFVSHSPYMPKQIRLGSRNNAELMAVFFSSRLNPWLHHLAAPLWVREKKLMADSVGQCTFKKSWVHF